MPPETRGTRAAYSPQEPVSVPRGAGPEETLNARAAAALDGLVAQVRATGGRLRIRQLAGVYWAEVRGGGRAVLRVAGTLERAVIGAAESWIGGQS